MKNRHSKHTQAHSAPSFLQAVQEKKTEFFSCSKNKDGFLSKQGGKLKKWKKRYFSLNAEKGGVLEWFSQSDRKEHLGEIPLTGSIVTTRALSKRHILSLKSTAKGGKWYVLEADSNEQLESWLLALADHGTSVYRPIKEGYLDIKLSTKITKSKWQKRYFVQFEDVLEYYNDINAGVPSGQIPLPSAAEIKKETTNDILAGKKFAFSILSTQDHGCQPVYIGSDDGGMTSEWINSMQSILDKKEKIVQICANSFKEGYLMKANPRGGDWKKRYFILLEDRIQYFKVKGDKQFAGEIILYSSSMVYQRRVTKERRASGSPFKTPRSVSAAGYDKISPDNLGFSILPSQDEGERTYHFKAMDIDEVNSWMDWIKQVISKQPAKTHSDSLKEGYLYREKKKTLE